MISPEDGHSEKPNVDEPDPWYTQIDPETGEQLGVRGRRIEPPYPTDGIIGPITIRLSGQGEHEGYARGADGELHRFVEVQDPTDPQSDEPS